MKKIISLIILVVLMTACQSVDPYTGEQQASKKTKYSIGGAIAGAVAGQIAGKDTESTLKGAAIGGLAGLGIGAYQDKQEAALREKLQGTGVSIKREGNMIELVMPSNITFKLNSSDISSTFYDVLDSVAIVLEEYDETNIYVYGHTDSTGTDEINNKLSKERADSVSRYIISRGIGSSRITSLGYGSKYPIASNNTEEGRAQNRRVEIEILPIQ